MTSTNDNAMKTPIAPWFGRLVSEELSRLYLLRLEYSPSNDTFPAVVEVWVDLLWNSRNWIESLDSNRLRVGFSQLLLSHRIWPKPADLIQSIPDRPPVMALPTPEPTPEQKQRNKDRIAELITRLGQPSRREKDVKSTQT